MPLPKQNAALEDQLNSKKAVKKAIQIVPSIGYWMFFCDDKLTSPTKRQGNPGIRGPWLMRAMGVQAAKLKHNRFTELIFERASLTLRIQNLVFDIVFSIWRMFSQAMVLWTKPVGCAYTFHKDYQKPVRGSWGLHFVELWWKETPNFVLLWLQIL